MEPPRESPLAEHEKVYLLGEIIKASNGPHSSHVLFQIIQQNQINPRWEDIPLPQGRSVRDCQRAFQELRLRFEHDPRPIPALPSPALYHNPELSKKRPLQPDLAASAGRLLQPRPSHPFASPDQYGGPAYQMAQAGEPAQKKKRGRPTKAEAQARADAAAARGEPYPPPSRKKTTSRPSMSSPGGDGGSMSSSGVGPVSSAAPLDAERLPGTPQMGSADAHDAESESGKRRRMRPGRLELGELLTSTIDPSRPMQESPTVGLGVARPDSARALYPQPALSEGPSPAAERRDMPMEGIEEYSQQSQSQHQQQQQHQQQHFQHPHQLPQPPAPPQTLQPPHQPQPPIPPRPQTNTPHSFKETVGM